MNISFEKTFDNLITAVLVLNTRFEVQYANQATLSFLKTGRKQLYGNIVDDFVLFSSLDKTRFRAALEHHENFSENEVELCLLDESILLFDIGVTYINNEEQDLLLIEAKHIDQQKRISKENQQAAQQHAAKELVRGLAHEIKNPLGGIRGAAQLLAMELSSPEQKEYTQMIIKQSDRLRGLVDRLLGPNSLPQFTWQNIHIPIEAVFQLVKLDNHYNINIVRDYDPSIPDVYIDANMIQQAVLNIVKNAMQALHDAQSKLPKIKIKTRVARHQVILGKKVPLCAVIYIYDNGPGVPKALRDTLFYPMVSSKQSGSGLGLSIAQTLIEHHNGKIELESRKGRTEFAIFLPITKHGETA